MSVKPPTPAYTVAALRNKLTQIYEEHKPDGIPKIEYLLKKYEGEETVLYKSVCSKYDIESRSGCFVIVTGGR